MNFNNEIAQYFYYSLILYIIYNSQENITIHIQEKERRFYYRTDTLLTHVNEWFIQLYCFNIIDHLRIPKILMFQSNLKNTGA